ncbi:hypothetical protein [Guggenheimella bovis]
MIWLKIIECVLYHIGLELIISSYNPLARIVVLISFIVASIQVVKDFDYKNKDKVLLQKLGTFIALVEAGNSPRHSYEEIGSFELPSYFIHPSEREFRLSIFKNQAELFEKQILLREDLESEFQVIRYRMKMMKILPIIIMLLMRFVLPSRPSDKIELVTVLGFIITYYLSDFWIKNE